MDQMSKENDLANKEREIVEQQFVNLKTLHEKLTTDMEMLMNDRESQRKENRSLRKEVSEGQQFIDKLQKEKVSILVYLMTLICFSARFVQGARSADTKSKRSR